MAIKGITRRWAFNSLGVILVVLMILIISFSMLSKDYIYKGIQLRVDTYADDFQNRLSQQKNQSQSEFLALARDYIENTSKRENAEIMILNAKEEVVSLSSGFPPPEKVDIPEYQMAVSNGKNYGMKVLRLSSNEKVMAISRVFRDRNGYVLGGVRYIVSLEEVDQQIFTLVLAMIGIGLLIILFVVFSGSYFIKTIVTPVRQINATAKSIAMGNFDARIEKMKDDELGDLCDTINDMAVALGASERMKNDFISAVSHELRTPLTAIKGWAETLLGVENIGKETHDKGMHVILRESERLSGIVEELLDFSKMQSGRISLKMEKVDILEELGEAVYMFRERARLEQKNLEYEEPDTLPLVFADVDRLRQVFVNVLDNALKYTQKGGSIGVTASQKEDYICVTISDTGCGIPPEHLPKIKEKFYKANQTIQGSGIGLALADEIVCLHGGILQIDSYEGIGTVVNIYIPI